KHQALPLVGDARATLEELLPLMDGWHTSESYRERVAREKAAWERAVVRASDPKQVHRDYGYSCMGYEIAAGLGVKMAAHDREVYVLVGDGSYLMMAQEVVTSIQERVRLTILVLDNHGFASIGGLSESVGCSGFATEYRCRDSETGLLTGDVLPVDFVANAESLGARAIRACTPAAIRD